MSVKLSQRQASLDVVRLVAIASVLVVHVLECSFQTSPSDMAGMLLGKQILIITLFCFGRLGVPLFLFLTGYLMLDRKYDLANLKSFYKERVGRLLIITWIWVTIYYAVGVLVLDRKPAPASYLRQLLFMQDSFAPQMWYMPMIIGLYIFIPMLANILPQLRGRTIVGLLGVGAIYQFIVPTVDALLTAMGRQPSRIMLDTNYFGSVYAIMMICGYLVKRYKNEIASKLKPWMAVCGGIVSFVLAVGLTYYEVIAKRANAMPWYDSTFIFIVGLCLFLSILYYARGLKPKRWLEVASGLTFGVYLSHYLFIYTYAALDRTWWDSNSWLTMLTVTIVALVPSIIFCLLTRKAPKLARALGTD